MTSPSRSPLDGAARPRRASRFSLVRERVTEAIERELGNQLVILRAPRGAGKTEALGHLVASLWERDDRAAVLVAVRGIGHSGADGGLWARVLAGFAEAEPAGAHAASMPDLEKVVERLGDEPALLVLDDVDAVTAGAITPDLLRILDACPGLCVVVAGRELTGLETPRISVQCDTGIIDASVLHFTRAETAALFALGGVVVAEETADRARLALGSWPATIRLAAAHLRFRGDDAVPESAVVELADTVLEDYAGEIVSDLSPDLVRFAAEAAVPPHLTSDLVEAVPFSRADRPATEIISRLEAAGLGGWATVAGRRLFHISPPLRGPLLARLEGEDPAIAAGIRRATAEHLGRHGDALVAAELAADAEDWSLVVSLLEARFAECWARGPARLERLTARIPAAAVEDSGPLAVAVLALRSESDFGPQALAQIERLLTATRPTRGLAGIGAVAAETRRVLLRRRSGEFGLAATTADELADLVDQHAARDRSPSDVRAEALLQIGIAYLHAGRPKEGRWRLTEASRSAIAVHLRVAAVGTLALTDVLRGNVDDAAMLLRGLDGDETRPWMRSPWGVAARLASAGVALENGRVRDAATMLDSVEAAYPTSESWPVLAALRVTQHLLDGDPYAGTAAVRALEERNTATPVSRVFDGHLTSAHADLLVALRQSRRAVDLVRKPSGVHDGTAAALARALLFAGQEQHAFVVAQQWSSRDQASPRTMMQALIVRATTDLRMGRTDAARDGMARAFAVTTSTGLKLPWSTMPAEDAEPLAALLPAGARDTVSALPFQFRENLTIPRLSERETIVLARLQSGAPIAQIARSLTVSPNTVKTQVRSVYRKLGASTRTEAIRSAHEWGILRPDGSPSAALTGS